MSLQGLMLYALLGFFFSMHWCNTRKKPKMFVVWAVWPWFAFLFVMGQITRNF